MFANDCRRIALAQGLLQAGERRPQPGDAPPAPAATEAASPAPEPCEERGDAA